MTSCTQGPFFSHHLFCFFVFVFVFWFFLVGTCEDDPTRLSTGTQLCSTTGVVGEQVHSCEYPRCSQSYPRHPIRGGAGMRAMEPAKTTILLFVCAGIAVIHMLIGIHITAVLRGIIVRVIYTMSNIPFYNFS